MNVEVSLVLQLLFVSRTLKNVFVGILGVLLAINGEKWQSWCGLWMVVVLEGGEG